VLNASWLGIYGNCVIVDHGMGVRRSYGHLSSFASKSATRLPRPDVGRSGKTGWRAAITAFHDARDGRMVNPVEWWIRTGLRNRVMRKLKV